MSGALKFVLFGRSWALAILCAATLVSLPTAHADVSVATGPTTIPRGDATGARDITISNDLSALAIAVDAAPPWGVARGGIVDVAIVRDGEPDYDIASLADFMPNNWSSWPIRIMRHLGCPVDTGGRTRNPILKNVSSSPKEVLS